MPGFVPAIYMFNSFPCIRIQNEYAGECAEWFYTQARHRDCYKEWIRSGKHDDGFWRDFFLECHGEERVWNLAPAMVEHVDWLIGGSMANKWRGYICRASYWEDEDLVQELAVDIARRRRAFFMPTRGSNAGKEKHS
jgi:hypothetical protein